MRSVPKSASTQLPSRPRQSHGVGRLLGGLLTILLIAAIGTVGYLLTRTTAPGVLIANANKVGDAALPATLTPTNTALALLPTSSSSIDSETATVIAANSLQGVLQQVLAQSVTPPTASPVVVAQVASPIGSSAPNNGSAGQGFSVPTLASTLMRPDQPTYAVPTAASSPVPLNVIQGGAINSRQNQWSLPPQQVPLSRDPRDHFYFRRPVDSNANSTSLFSYPYGSMGPDNAWRVHHGIDLPNPDGKPVRAAAAGVVVWAADHYRWVESGVVVDEAESYGNVVIVAHNFGYNGQQLYTLYAHLSRILVTQNQTVSAGDVVGLSGHTGQVSGPHVHFEIREGDNLYFNTRNPILWMAPLVGTGVIAGKVLYQNGRPVQNASVVLFRDGKQIDQTSTYVYPKVDGVAAHQVDGDDQWHESFAFGDVPKGTYMVQITIGNLVLTHAVSVQEGTTSLVDFGYVPGP